MAKKHQIKSSKKSTRTKANRSWRRKAELRTKKLVKDMSGFDKYATILSEERRLRRKKTLKREEKKKQLEGLRELNDGNLQEVLSELSVKK